MSIAPLTLGQILSGQARLQPDKIAVRDLQRALSYRQWNARACRLANALLGLGLSKGERVAVMAYNRLEWAEIYAAVAKAGLVAVPINFRLTAAEAQYIVEDCGAAALLVEDALIPVIESVRDARVVPAERVVVLGEAPAGWHGYEDLLCAGAETEPGESVGADDPWCLMYTSGTTGRPKGAIRGHRGMAMLALMTQVELGLHRHDVALLVMPMCHANSLNFFTGFVYCGATVTIFSRKRAPPPPLMRRRKRSSSSAPSTVRSISGLSSRRKGTSKEFA